MTQGNREQTRTVLVNTFSAFLIGAIGGIAWNVQTRQRPLGQDRLIDWARVRQIARLVSRRLPLKELPASLLAEREAGYRAVIQQVGPRMLAYLGTGSESEFRFAAWAHAVDRQTWIDANIDNFRTIFEPVEELLRDRIAGRLAQPINQQASSLFLGAMLGYLSGRVLGQYDPRLLGKEALAPGELFFVEPNLEAARLELAVPRDQFVTWIVFHELTHSWQFEAHPWLRDFMNGQVRRLIATATGRLIDTDVAELLRLAMRGEVSLRQPQRMVSALMTAEQRDIFDRLQGLMCLVEGFSNHVMDALGPQMLPDYYTIARKFEVRQNRRTAAEQLFMRATGLQMKMEQYRAGEAFVEHVVRQKGIEFMNRAWESANRLPVLQEIYSPASWIRRIEEVSG